MGSYILQPITKDILLDLSKAEVFLIYDIKRGFWHVRLEDESSCLTTFSTPFGHYQWLGMPMKNINLAEIFQQKLTYALEDLHGVHIMHIMMHMITGQVET